MGCGRGVRGDRGLRRGEPEGSAPSGQLSRRLEREEARADAEDAALATRLCTESEKNR